MTILQAIVVRKYAHCLLKRYNNRIEHRQKKNIIRLSIIRSQAITFRAYTVHVFSMFSSIRTKCLASFLFIGNCHAHSHAIDKFGSFYFPCNRRTCIQFHLYFCWVSCNGRVGGRDMAEKKARFKTFNPINNDKFSCWAFVAHLPQPNFVASNIRYDLSILMLMH